jgi:hypothetical protein
MAIRHKRRNGEIEFKLLVVATLPAFFLATIVKRAMPWNWGRDKRSLLAATLAAANNSIPFAFM